MQYYALTVEVQIAYCMLHGTFDIRQNYAKMITLLVNKSVYVSKSYRAMDGEAISLVLNN